MELGMIGLGRMGANMTERLAKGGHRVVGFDPKPEARARVEEGAPKVGPAKAEANKSQMARRLNRKRRPERFAMNCV